MSKAGHRSLGALSGPAGAVAAMLAYVCAERLGILALVVSIGLLEGLVIAAIAGGLLARFRAGGVLLIVLVVLCLAAWSAVRFTTLSESFVSSLTVAEAPRPADAIVVLTSGLFEDGTIDGEGEVRFVRGLELAGQSYAPTVVVTRLSGRGGERLEAVTRQVIQHLRLTPRLAVVGPIANTHDEAVATAALAGREGWRHILLVTSPYHSRRAVETFRKAGLIVTSVPSAPAAFGPVPRGGNRLTAFRACLHEYVGRIVYRRRGWI